MHVPFDPGNVDWSIYTREHDEVNGQFGGGAYAVFRGMPYQRGTGIGSVFRSVLRFLMPLGKEAGMALGRQGLESGQRILSNILEGQPPKDALVSEGRTAAKNLIDKSSSRLSSAITGKGRRRRHRYPLAGGSLLTEYKKRRNAANIRKRLGLYNATPNDSDNTNIPTPHPSPLRRTRKQPTKKRQRVDILGPY